MIAASSMAPSLGWLRALSVVFSAGAIPASLPLADRLVFTY